MALTNQYANGARFRGDFGDTPQFTVDALARWWTEPGQTAYPEAEPWLMLAAAGGRNHGRFRVFKQPRLARAHAPIRAPSGMPCAGQPAGGHSQTRPSRRNAPWVSPG